MFVNIGVMKAVLLQGVNENFAILYILRLISIREFSKGILFFYCEFRHINCSFRVLTLLYSKQLHLFVDTKSLMYVKDNVFHSYVFLRRIIFGTVLRDYRVLVGRPERKTPVGSPRCKW